MVQPRIRGRFAEDPLNPRGRGSIKAESVGRAMGFITDEAVKVTYVGLTVSMREAVEQAASQATGAIQQDIALFSRSLANKTRRNRDSRVTRINQIAGDTAQRATVRSFAQYHPSRSEVYRSKSRMARGALKRALGSPGFFQARWDGVAFGNRAILDATAKQWYRLNFGAGARGDITRRPGRFNIKFFGVIAGELSLNANRAGPSFDMPEGVWISRQTGRLAVGAVSLLSSRQTLAGSGNPLRRGDDEFLALNPNKGYIESLKIRKNQFFLTQEFTTTLGVVGTNYLDAGVSSLARQLGKGWTVLMREWFQEAAVSGTGPVAQRIQLDGGDFDINRALQRITQAQTNMQDALRRFESSLF